MSTFEHLQVILILPVGTYHKSTTTHPAHDVAATFHIGRGMPQRCDLTETFHRRYLSNVIIVMS